MEGDGDGMPRPAPRLSIQDSRELTPELPLQVVLMRLCPTQKEGLQCCIGRAAAGISVVLYVRRRHLYVSKDPASAALRCRKTAACPSCSLQLAAIIPAYDVFLRTSVLLNDMASP